MDTVLCSGTLGRIPYSDKISAAVAAGFTAVSIYYREAERPAEIRRALADAGLFLAELDGPMGWLPGRNDLRAPSPAQFVDRAVALGARSITIVEVTGTRPPLDVAVEAFAEVCDLAQSAGVLVHIEPFPWSGINDFGFAADIVAGAGRANGGILLDTWHLFRGPDRGALPLQIDPKSIVGLQINDVAAEASENLPYEAMHRRLLPGTGAAAADIRGLLRALRNSGCDAPLGVEVFSDELAVLPPDEIARRCADALQQLTG